MTGEPPKGEAGNLASPTPGLTGATAKGEVGGFTPPPQWFNDDQSALIARAEEARRRAFIAATSSGITEPLLPLAQGVSQKVTLDTTVIRGDPQSRHAQMMALIPEVEKWLAEVKKLAAPGIGHNKPPTPIDPAPPLSRAELEQIRKDIATLKAQPPVPAQAPPEVTAAASRFGKAVKLIMAYVAKQTNNFATAAVASAGTMTVAWLFLGNNLEALCNAVILWLKSLTGL